MTVAGAAGSARSVNADRCRPRLRRGGLAPAASLAAGARRRQPGRRRPGAAVGPLDHLLLVGERDAGDGHDEDDDAGGDAGGEVHPEETVRKLFISGNLETMSQLPSKLIAD